MILFEVLSLIVLAASVIGFVFVLIELIQWILRR